MPFGHINFKPQNIVRWFKRITGDVTFSFSSGISSTIGAAKVTNAKLATMAANTFKANATTGAATPTDVALAVSQLAGRGTGNIAAIALGSSLKMLVGAATLDGIITRNTPTAPTGLLLSRLLQHWGPDGGALSAMKALVMPGLSLIRMVLKPLTEPHHMSHIPAKNALSSAMGRTSLLKSSMVLK